MNENQKCFLKELSDLFDKYNVEEMRVFNERITFISNQEYIGVVSFIREKEEDMSYFTDIFIEEKSYITRDNRYKENNNGWV